MQEREEGWERITRRPEAAKEVTEAREQRTSNEMPIDCYYLPPSPPCRTVVLLAKALGVHFNFKMVNVMKGEHMSPEFLQVTRFTRYSFTFALKLISS